MRATRTLSISISPAQLQQAEKLASREHRTMSELVREALRCYQDQRHLARVNTALLAALRALQHEAAAKGAARLTRRQINTEIAAVRRDKAARSPLA